MLEFYSISATHFNEAGCYLSKQYAPGKVSMKKSGNYSNPDRAPMLNQDLLDFMAGSLKMGSWNAQTHLGARNYWFNKA
jgi:hypothetical protein